MHNCKVMICDDSVLAADESMVRTCYAMSKQTVVNELDDNLNRKYLELPFCEFLEFIARLVDMLFEESELA